MKGIAYTAENIKGGKPMKTITSSELLKICPNLKDSIAQRQERWTARDILGLRDIPHEEKLWAVLREELIAPKTLHEFACRCAERALARVASPDPRSVEAIAAKRAWLRGEITDSELKAAEATAWAAVWDVAQDAAKAAARAAAIAAMADAVEAATAAAASEITAAASKIKTSPLSIFGPGLAEATLAEMKNRQIQELKKELKEAEGSKNYLGKSVTPEELLEFMRNEIIMTDAKDAIPQLQERWTALDIIDLDEIEDDEKLKLVLRPELIDEKTLHEFSCRCAERALARIDNPDPRSLAAIAAKRAWLRGEISDDELKAAQAAALAAQHEVPKKSISKGTHALVAACAAEAADPRWYAAIEAASSDEFAAYPDDGDTPMSDTWSSAWGAAARAERAWQVHALKEMLSEEDPRC